MPPASDVIDENVIVLLAAWFNGNVEPARPTVTAGTTPASKTRSPSETVWAVP